MLRSKEIRSVTVDGQYLRLMVISNEAVDQPPTYRYTARAVVSDMLLEEHESPKLLDMLVLYHSRVLRAERRSLASQFGEKMANEFRDMVVLVQNATG